jgi:hypothetical protein
MSLCVLLGIVFLFVDHYHPEYFRAFSLHQSVQTPDDSEPPPRTRPKSREATQTRPPAPSTPVDPVFQRQLKREQKRLETAEALLNHNSSYAARVRIYCRYEMGLPESRPITMGTDITGEDLEDRYRYLLTHEPNTQEEETERQLQLQGLRYNLAGYEQSVDTCIGLRTNYGSLPSDDEERAEVEAATQRIAQIRKTIAIDAADK